MLVCRPLSLEQRYLQWSSRPGQHILSVILRPNQLNLRPTQKRLTVIKGQTYTLTASWQDETLVLL